MTDLTIISEETLLKRDAFASKKSQEYADHVHAEKLYEGLCKDFLAALKMQFREQFSDASESELETRARASDDWRTFRKKEMDVLRLAGRKEIAYKNAERSWKTMQSCLSARKKELDRIS